MPQRRRRQFVWIPPNRTTSWTVTIDGVDVSDFVIEGKFPDGLITEELIAEIELDNSGEDFKDRFKLGDTVVFKMDFDGGDTTQFEGEIEEIKNKIEGGLFKIGIRAAHNLAHLLDVTVTEEFTDASISDIRRSLLDKYFKVQ